METRETTDRINKAGTWFCGRKDRNEKPLARITKRKRQRIQVKEIMNKTWDTAADNCRGIDT